MTKSGGEELIVKTAVGHLTRALDDLAGEHFDVLSPAIADFADAVAWPRVNETRQS